MTSLSTRFLGQPRLTNPTLVGAVGLSLDLEMTGSSTVVNFFDMQSFYSSILESGAEQVNDAQKAVFRSVEVQLRVIYL